MRFRAVFFDAGETLVHPDPSFPELFARITQARGHVVRPDDVVEASKVVLERFSEAADDRELWTTSPERSRRFWMSVYDSMLDALGLGDHDGLPDLLYRAFTDRSNYTLFDDVRPAIARLETEGVILGLVSNFEAWLDDLLVDLDLRESFAVRVISGLEGIEKPDPRIYQLALQRADIAPSEAAYVGDNPIFDVDPPAALGMHPVLIDRRNRHPDFEGVRITDLRDLGAVLA
jgi:putative hydrolase of the HAD superfamily